MRICGTSDFHGRLPRDIGSCDLLLIVGDLCPHGECVGTDEDREVQTQWLISRFLTWVERQRCNHWLITGGNHDFVFESARFRDALPSRLLDRLLLDRTVAVSCGSEQIRVHGAPWSLPFHNWAFMASEAEMAAHLDNVPQDVDVLMVHTPPWGIADRTADRYDAGSQAVLAAIKSKRPLLSLHGHIHEGSGQSRLLEEEGRKTLVYNVCHLDNWYMPTNLPVYFSLTKAGAEVLA